jgi:Arc/MetJ family transcription regulator
MRTNIEIDDELIAAAMTATGSRTKREAVNLALLEVVRQWRQRRIADNFGLLGEGGWSGDLDAMRLDRDA